MKLLALRLTIVIAAFLIIPHRALAYWHVVQTTELTTADAFCYPADYFRQGSSAFEGLSYNQSGLCPGDGGCDGTGSFRHVHTYVSPPQQLTGYSCGLPAPYGWDSVYYTVPYPMAAQSPVFRNPDNGLYYPFAMFHMSQASACLPSSGSLGSIGMDFSNDGLSWTAYSGNPVLNDPQWAALGFQPPEPCGPSPNASNCSSVEKSSIVLLNGTFYMAATVANRSPGYEDSIQCNNNRTLAYLLKSTDGVNWTRADGNGLLNVTGIVWPTAMDGTWQTVHGPWLVNISIAYDPATQYVYMTRTYASNMTCANSPGS